MARGGARQGAGRHKGGANKLNDAARTKALAGGLTPLDYLLALLRDEDKPQEVRIDAAKAAAPYVHARLAAVELSGNLNVNHEEALDELDSPRAADQAKTKG